MTNSRVIATCSLLHLYASAIVISELKAIMAPALASLIVLIGSEP